MVKTPSAIAVPLKTWQFGRRLSGLGGHLPQTSLTHCTAMVSQTSTATFRRLEPHSSLVERITDQLQSRRKPDPRHSLSLSLSPGPACRLSLHCRICQASSLVLLPLAQFSAQPRLPIRGTLQCGTFLMQVPSALACKRRPGQALLQDAHARLAKGSCPI